MLRNFGSGAAEVAGAIRPLRGTAETERGLRILREDFLEPDGAGPTGVALFLQQRPDDEIQADVAGYVRLLQTLLDG